MRGALFVWGGYFPFFTENRPQKHKKHAILHTSQANGWGSSPPRPPLATLLIVSNFTDHRFEPLTSRFKDSLLLDQRAGMKQTQSCDYSCTTYSFKRVKQHEISAHSC